MMIVLGIETSCDDTACAVVKDGYEILSSQVSGQEEFHHRFGGVVPEIASRAHLEVIDLVVKAALEDANITLDDVDAIAVTNGPGLMGSLLVGVNFAKGMAFSSGLKFYGVNHLEGHMAAPFLNVGPPEYPLVGLVASGGHTNLYLMTAPFENELLGRTVDDAAGEAFDKIAKYLGLGYPGGPLISKLAETGDPNAYDFPRPMLHSHDFNFSFSGLKTAVINQVKQLEDPDEKALQDVAASFQEAATDLMCAKLKSAMVTTGAKRLAISGGVAANARLREKISQMAKKHGWGTYFPIIAHCTDNAAMVAAAGYQHLVRGETSELDLNTYANSPGVPKGRLRKSEKQRKIPGRSKG